MLTVYTLSSQKYIEKQVWKRRTKKGGRKPRKSKINIEYDNYGWTTKIELGVRFNGVNNVYKEKRAGVVICVKNKYEDNIINTIKN